MPYILRHAEDGPGMAWGIRQATYDDYREDEDQSPRDVTRMLPHERDAIYERYVWRLSGSPALLARGNPRLAFVNFAWAARPEIGPDRARDFTQAALGRGPDGMWGTQTMALIDRTDDEAAAGRYLELWTWYYRARAGDEGARAQLVRCGFARKALPGCDPAPRLAVWLRRVARASALAGVPLQALQHRAA